MAEEEPGAEASASEDNTFGLPEKVLKVLPSDPFVQLDVARRITSLALASRVSALELEFAVLRHQLSDKDRIVADLRRQIESLESAVSDATEKLAAAEQEKEMLLQEKAQLSNTVRKLNIDVSKLEVFRKTLMQSLQEDEDGSNEAMMHSIISTTQSNGRDDDFVVLPSAHSSIQSQTSKSGNSLAGHSDTNVENRLRISPHLLLESQTNIPGFTPLGSPPIQSASVSRRRHSISLTSSQGLFDITNSSNNPSSSPSYDGGSQARKQVDRKEFLHQVRSRLSYEQFGAFLANVKELKPDKSSKETTLRKAEEIFGHENKDLYKIFEGLVSRNMH